MIRCPRIGINVSPDYPMWLTAVPVVLPALHHERRASRQLLKLRGQD